MGYESICNNLDEENTEEYWEPGIMRPESHISMCPAYYSLLVGFLSR